MQDYILKITTRGMKKNSFFSATEFLSKYKHF